MNDSPLPQSGRDLDGLLHDYFHAQVPPSWPLLHLPEARPQSWWRRSRLRVALAASVALGLAGYLSLAGHFPRAVPTTALELNGPNIADRPTHRTPRPAPMPAKE
jgi:hypothetical protein